MYTYLYYIYSLVTVLIINCAHPINWGNCSNVHQWLPPYFNDYKIFNNEWVKPLSH